MSEENKRNYDMSDSELLAAAEVMLKNFKEHKEDFFAFNPEQFNEQFIKDFEEAIATAKALDTDAIEPETPITETADADTVKEECTVVLEKFAFFVRRAFRDSEAVCSQFGLDAFPTVINSPSRLTPFMETVAQRAAEYREQLRAVHCPERLLERVFELAEQLHEEKAARATAVRAQAEKSEGRAKEALNNLLRRLLPGGREGGSDAEGGGGPSAS